jgi:hypothetical protein
MTGKMINLEEVQKEQIKKIRQSYGCSTDAESIRVALRIASEVVSK